MMSDLPVVRAALAVVRNGDRVLVGRRAPGAYLSGLREFPGGRIEADESPPECAVRETREEAGIEIRVTGSRPALEYDYPDRRVILYPFDVKLVTGDPLPPFGWLRVETLSDDEFPPATGRIHLVDEQGVSVISDIDDTVKVRNVADRRELLRNTLLREFIPVAGMPEAYCRWQQAGAAFHYVSASPWQLSNCLCAFLGAAGLPSGSMHLKLFRLKDTTPLGRLTARKRSKRRTIEQIMDDFPGRRFVLVGDSGERDPEVYAAVARRRPEQVSGVLIRRVADRTAASQASLRFDKLARRLPEGALRTFTSAEELEPLP